MENVCQQSETLKQYFQESFPASEVKDEHFGMVTFEVSKDDASLSIMFQVLESLKPRFNIEDYFVAQTSLEMIFCGFASKQSFTSDSDGSEIPPHRRPGPVKRVLFTIAKWSPPGLIIRGFLVMFEKCCFRNAAETDNSEEVGQSRSDKEENLNVV
eukprot:Nk52_evm15s1967 gene=Nk52_evmTU15s1967